MPKVDGLEAARRIRALKDPRGQVPIVALTAQAFAEQVAECRQAGMNDHLAKPFTPEALLAVVARAAVTGGERRDSVLSADGKSAPATLAQTDIADGSFELTRLLRLRQPVGPA